MKTIKYLDGGIIEIAYDKCNIKYKKYLNTDELPAEGEFKLQDLKYRLTSKQINDISVIDLYSLYVYSEYRNNGIGTKYLIEFCNENPDSLIILTAGLHCDEADNISDDEIDEYTFIVLDRLLHFYTRNGFIDINSILGCYEGYCTMVYSNNYCKELFNKLEIELPINKVKSF